MDPKDLPRVILGEIYEDYSSALQLFVLEALHERREQRGLDFSLSVEITQFKTFRRHPITAGRSPYIAHGWPPCHVFFKKW